MSCYNWCSGTIKIPAKEWPAFRKAIIAAHNTYNERSFEIARRLHAQVKADSKHKRNYSFYNKVFDAVYNGNLSVPNHFKDLIYSSLLTQNYPNVKLKLPKKKDFPKATLKTERYGYFTLGHASKTITYNVEEDNRAVDSAAADVFVRQVFQLLNRITWTRGSGGTIVGNDEYNRDSEYEGGGANYVVHRFGTMRERAFIATYHY
jgi:hypothetical protein